MNKDRNSTEQDYESFSLKDFMLLCLGYWKWFLISIIFFFGLGFFYVYTRQPVFERSEEILVKDQEAGGGVGDAGGAFSNLGLFANQTKVYNELIAFTSPAVMFEVVNRLDLTMNYTLRDGVKRRTLYGTTLPIIISFPELSEKVNAGFRLSLQPDGNFTMTKMWRGTADGTVKYKGKFEGKVGSGSVKTPLGNIVIERNPGYFNSGEEAETQVMDIFKQSYQGAVESYLDKLKGDLTDQDADVINLSIQDTSVERADDILNTVVAVYNERWIEDKNKVALATSKFISERLEVIRDELGLVDDEIAVHKSAMKIPNLEEAAKGYMAQDFMMMEELLKASNFLAMTKYLKEYLQDPANALSILPMNTGTENPILEEQIGQYNELLLLRNNLAENSGANNPLVKDKDKALAGMRSAIMRSIDSQIANLQNAVKNIDSAQSKTQQQLSTTPIQAKALLSVERQQLVMEELYLFLLQKREETELTQKFTADNIRVVTPPFGRQKPVSPKRALMLIIFFAVGVGIPAAALFIAESSDTKVRSKKDIENLSVPFAGEIPMVGKDRRWIKLLQSKKKKQKIVDKPKAIVVEGKRDIPNEAFRVVRSNLDFMLGRGQKAVLALTSFNPGSGKSFIAYNLGASFAIKGKKVLLVDCDLRHGSLSGYAGSPKKGLSTYLTGDASDWAALVVKISDVGGNLNILPIGNRPPNPAELLDNGKIATLIQEARNEYDVVLIDCPPINIVVDTQIINQYVDRTLFVIRAGLLEKKAIKELSTMVDEKKLKNITIILNGTKTEHSQYHSYGNYEAIEKMK